MLTTIIISIITCILLIASILLFPKIKIFNKSFNSFWMISLIGAFFIVVFNCISLKEIFNGLFNSTSMNPIKILVLFFSMTFLSIFLDEVGFFKYLANVLVNKCKSNQKNLFSLMYFLIALLTIFTSNDIVILTFTPFICYFAKSAKISPIPYLIAEFAAANTWSMMLIIGNPTNIYLASAANIDFIHYFKIMFIPTILAGLTQFILIYFIFNKSLSTPLQLSEHHKKINDKITLGIGLSHLLLCLVLLVISSYIKLDMYLICLFCCISLIMIICIFNLITKRKNHNLINTTKRLPYNLIPFVLSMFIIVLAINKQGISNQIGTFLGNKNIVFNYGLTSFISSNLINNIPMSVLFSTVPHMDNITSTYKAVFSIIIGSNIGAFLTPIGALAGIMFTDLINKQNIKYSFLSFVKYGSLIAFPTLFIALISLNFLV